MDKTLIPKTGNVIAVQTVTMLIAVVSMLIDGITNEVMEKIVMALGGKQSSK